MGQETPGRLGHFYHLLFRTSQALLRIPDSQNLLETVCRLICQMEGYHRVRITQNQSPLLVTAADSGSGDAPPFFWEKHVLDRGRSVINNDLGQGGDARYGPWEAAALFPLWVETSVWGCLALYSRDVGTFVPQEVSLLEELSRDVSRGLRDRIQDQKRKENEQFLSDMANLVPGLFYKLRFHPREGFQFLYVSPGIDLLLPVSPTQALADSAEVFRFLHPEDLPRFQETGNRSRDYLTVFSLEFRLVRPNGSVVWVLATAFPQKLLDEAVVWTGLAIDVTPQHRLQEALHHEQELLEVILNNIGDGVVAVDEDDRLLLVNKTAGRFLDHPEGRGALESWRDLAPDLPWGPTDRFHPWVRMRADGTALHLEAHVSVLNDQGNLRRGRVMLLRDTTERDQIEERLRQSEKLESIGLLAGGIAHDFNNLLTGVFGFIQLARMNTDDPEKTVMYLDHAMGPFQRARTLTQHLLTFAKGGEISKEALRLSDLIPEVLQHTLAGSPVSGEVRAQETPWIVWANKAQLHQVFENLFVNARQALPDGGRLTVTLRNLPPPGPVDRGLAPQSYVEILVENDGPVIASDILPKIFDPFFSTKPGGTGLGLSICFSVLKKHGGAIEAENLPSGGCGFRLFLPAQLPTPSSETSG